MAEIAPCVHLPHTFTRSLTVAGSFDLSVRHLHLIQYCFSNLDHRIITECAWLKRFRLIFFSEILFFFQ